MMMFERFLFCLVLFATVMIVGATANVTTARAQNAPIVVDGEPITELEIEQRSKFTQAVEHKVLSRNEVIDELRDEKLKVHEAMRAGLTVTDSEVDEAYSKTGRRMRITPERVTEILQQLGVSADTVKHRLRADLASKKMLGSALNPGSKLRGDPPKGGGPRSFVLSGSPCWRRRVDWPCRLAVPAVGGRRGGQVQFHAIVRDLRRDAAALANRPQCHTKM
jgi:hypothetical protein